MKINKFQNFNENNIMLYVISVMAIVGLFILDSSNIYSYIFALIYLGVIYMGFNQSYNKAFYYITLLFAIMSTTLGVHLKKYIGIDEQINLYYIYLFIYIVIFGIKFVKNIRENIKLKWDYINVLFLVFAIYTFASFILAKDKKIAIVELLYYGVMFGLVIMIMNENRSEYELKDTLRFLGVVSCGIVLMGLFKIITGIQIESKSVYLIPGTPMSSIDPPFNRIPTLFFYNPNNYALVAVIILIGLSILFISKSRYDKRLIFIMLVITEINIFFTRSRTGWIATIITIVFILAVLLIKKKWKQALMLLTPIIIFGVLFKGLDSINDAGFLYDKLGELEHSVVDENGNVVEGTNISVGSNGSINVRATLYIDIIEGIFKERNLLGFGAGNINEYIRERDNTHGRYDPHSWWFEILGDFGVIGFLSFTLGYFLMALRLFIRYISNKTLEETSLLCLALLATTSMLVFSPSSVLRSTPFWVVIAISLSTSNLIIKKRW